MCRLDAPAGRGIVIRLGTLCRPSRHDGEKAPGARPPAARGSREGEEDCEVGTLPAVVAKVDACGMQVEITMDGKTAEAERRLPGMITTTSSQAKSRCSEGARQRRGKPWSSVPR